MIVIGIDPGSNVAGYGVLRVSRPRFEYIQCGVLKLPKGRPLNARLELLCADLSEISDEFCPDAYAIERAFLDHDHPQAAIVLSEVRGMVKGFAMARGKQVLEYAPATVKRAGGDGSRSSDQDRSPRSVDAPIWYL